MVGTRVCLFYFLSSSFLFFVMKSESLFPIAPGGQDVQLIGGRV